MKMSEQKRLKVKKEHEMRTKDISRMIAEGGMGADKYYNIVKDQMELHETNNESKALDKNKKADE